MNMTKRVVTVIMALLVSIVAFTIVLADGTETLGTPSIGISDGTGIILAGTGLFTQPGEISVKIPKGIEIQQVLLYWGDRTDKDLLDGAFVEDTSVVVNGVVVTGVKIGGPSVPLPSSHVASTAYRADITDEVASNNWLTVGKTKILTIEGLDFDSGARQNLVDGAGVLVIIDDGSAPGPLEVRDGSDYANSGLHSGDPLGETVPQTYGFASSLVDRAATVSLFVGDISQGRANTIEITSGGVTTVFDDPLFSNDGDQWDTFTTIVNVPAGATSLTVHVISGGDGKPASLHWITAAVSVEHPGIGRMTGGNNIKIGDVGLGGITGGLTIHCDITLSNNLQVNWGPRSNRNRFHLDKPILTAVCIDDENVDPVPPAAPFDTFIGTAVGKFNGEDGATIEFTFVDRGERSGAPPDQAAIKITDVKGVVQLDLPLTDLTGGNLQAHYDQPHK